VPRCSRCGLEYTLRDPSSYRSQPTFLRWKFWFPGLMLAIVSGVLSYGIVLSSGEMGWSLFFCVPISFGAIVGYATRAMIWIVIGLGLSAVAGVVMALVSFDITGFFCGATLGLIFVFPAMIGVTLGFILRVSMKLSQWDQRGYLPLLLLVLFPYASIAVEATFFPVPHELATVSTELTFHATAEEAWKSIQFYEQVDHEPPLYLRLMLPKPLRAEGKKAAVGDVTRCVYRRGHIAKRISQVEPGRLLAFDVIEQDIHFEHDVRLKDGNFRLEPDGDGKTRVILTTRYERWLRPSWLWQPIEEDVVHRLHGHVLEGMRRKAEQRSPTPVEPYRPAPSPNPQRQALHRAHHNPALRGGGA